MSPSLRCMGLLMVLLVSACEEAKVAFKPAAMTGDAGTAATSTTTTQSSSRFLAAQGALRESSCFKCHGAWEALSEDQWRTARAKAADRFLVEVGRSAESLLVERTAKVARKDSANMPPEGDIMTAANYSKLREWIDNMGTTSITNGGGTNTNTNTGGGTTSASASALRFPGFVAVLTRNNCLGCHSTWKDWNEAQWRAAVSSNGSPLVSPGSPAASILLNRIRAEGRSGPFRNMPEKSTAQMNEADYSTLENWIVALGIDEGGEPIECFGNTCRGFASQPLGEEALLARCYHHLLGSHLPPQHPLRKEVAEGRLKGQEACTKIIDSISIGTNNLVTSSAPELVSEENAQDMLNQLYGIHKGFFRVGSFRSGGTGSKAARALDVLDETEPALFLTNHLLRGKTSTSLFEGSQVPYGLREDHTRDRKVVRIRRIDGPVDAEFTIPANFLHGRGLLRGVEMKATDSGFKPGVSLGAKDKVDPIEGAGAENRRSFGGGIIGLQTYFMMNSGLNFLEPATGGLHSPRRMSAAILSDFLCRDLPVMSSANEKILQIVDTSAAQKISYRRGSSCMSCHGTIDNMAAGYRNLELRFIDDYFTRNRPFPFVIRRPASGLLPYVDIKAEEGSPDYANRRATGRLLFTNNRGNVVDRNFEGIPQLGSALAAQQDVHDCLAKRYLHYFTGVDVSLDPLVEGGPYRELVFSLGAKLRAGNFKDLLKAIVALPLYRESSLQNVE